MFDHVLAHLIASVLTLAAAVGVFFAVNARQPVGGGRREFGTRRGRWCGYCGIAGVLVGYWVAGVLDVMAAGRTGAAVGAAKGYVHVVAYSGAPMTALAGLLAGLALGAISSRFIPERTRPPDPDAG